MPTKQLIRHLKFRELGYLVTLERQRSIHGAAEAHGISQPALSKILRELETVLGFKLFDRSRKGVTPTKLGEIVVAQAMQMLSHLDSMTAQLDAERHGQGLVLRIGATPNPALRLIPPAYAIARQTFSNLVVELVEDSTESLLTGLRRGRYMLVVGRSSSGESMSPFEQIPLYPEIGIVVARKNHPASGKRPTPLEDLLAFPWVLPAPGPTRAAIELGFMRAGCIPPAPAFINYSTQLVSEVLIHSDAVSVMPRGAVQSLLGAGKIAVIAAPEFLLPAYAIYKPSGVTHSAAMKCLEAAILEVSISMAEAHRAAVTG